jgi:sugar/nucleoside kinase (ribokinase family)
MPATPPAVLCAGLLVADLFVPPLPALPAAGQLLATEDFLAAPGGCAANVAIALRKLGVPVAVSGCVGHDVFGDFLLSDLRARDMAVDGIRRAPDHGTSKTVILPVVGEDRRYIHTFGANAAFGAEDLGAGTVPEGGVLYLGGFLALPALEPEAVAFDFQGARARGVRTVLDVVVPAGESPRALAGLEALLPHVDLFLPNREEAAALTGETEPRRQAARFHAAGCPSVIITCGAEGALASGPEGTLQAAAYEIDYVDGSGSGDAMTAGVIVGLLEGWDAERSLRFASAVGALACTRLGCSEGIRGRAETEAFIDRQPLDVRREAG